MQRVGSRVLRWVREWSSRSNEPIDAKRLVELISIIDDPDSYPPPSKKYSFYSDEITRVMAELGSEPRAREFLLDAYILSQAASVADVAVYFPPLREYVKRYRWTPELLVTLYTICSAVPPEEEGAGEWLKQASEMDPENEYVLWERFLSRGDPYFPEALIYSSNILEEQQWLLAKLLERNPQDPLALGVESYLKKTQRALGHTREDMKFRNSLRRIAPNPWRYLGLTGMLLYANDPRYIKRRFPQLAKTWFQEPSTP